MENLQRQLDFAALFIQQTWISIVNGDMGAPPGSPKLRFDSINQRKQYAESIVLGSSINLPDSGRFSREILATDPIAAKIEQGYSAWDMKPMLLGGPKARQGKKGLYNRIPFRHRTPQGSTQDQHFSGTMPVDIYAKAKQLRAATKRASGQRLLGTEKKYPPKKTHHVAGIYEGMVKVQGVYPGVAQHSQYVTIRTVSESSPPEAWWHPGRNAQPVIAFVEMYCKDKVEKMIQEAAELDMIPAGGLSVGLSIVER